MSKTDLLYSASCNPPRRVKRLPIVEPASLSIHPPLPMSTIPDIALPPAPAKRGRKPGPLSRSAREAQRRLNHSIIEKARRTKINDALATLRQLVPVDYGSSQSQHDDDDDDDDEDQDDEDYPDGSKKAKSKPKPIRGTGKREEKEKEFKLEILVRTVSFLQDLLKRVDTMENTLSVCQHCGANQSCRKRKHGQLYNDDEHDQPPKLSKVVVRSTEEHGLKPHSSPIAKSLSTPVPTLESPTNGAARLPSISSWLPDLPIDPTLLSPQTKPNTSPKNQFPYLPSPPSSTLCVPIRTSQVPPVLNLGPVATASMVALPLPPPQQHTSEDESAASLLLQIATSPPFRPSIPTPSTYNNLPDPSKFSLHSDVRNQRISGSGHRLPETPRSLLGLRREREY